MKKEFPFDNLVSKSKIVVHSSDYKIDFLKHSTFVQVFDSKHELDSSFYAERIIHDNNQKQTTVFEIPVIDQKMFLELTTNDYNLNEIKPEPC